MRIWVKIGAMVALGANLGLLVMNTWMHDLPMMVFGVIVVMIFSVFPSRLVWPVRQIEWLNSPPRVIREPVPADKASHDYKLGYEDGKGDARRNTSTGVPGLGHPIKVPTPLQPPMRP